MTVDDAAAKVSSRRRKASSKSPASATPDIKTVEASAMSGEDAVKAENAEATKEEAMSSDNVVKITARPVQADAQSAEAAIQLHQPVSMIWNRPVMPSDIEVAGTMTVAGVRPIAASHLELFGSFLNGRPISASSLKVQEMLPGNRPIFASEFRMVEGPMLLGDRPIMVSDPQLLHGSMLPGNRPIAPNDTVDPEPAALMGYLD